MRKVRGEQRAPAKVTGFMADRPVGKGVSQGHGGNMITPAVNPENEIAC
jgi:hypothetical protein